MPDYFSGPLAAIRQTIGVPIVYRRGATSIAIAQAVRGKRLTAPTDLQGNTVSTQRPDWIIAAGDLKNGATQWYPQDGDQIDYQPASGPLETYRVDPDGTGRAYEVSDTAGTTWRIHAIRI
ncbi:MAG: hypothetical protein NT069_33170 [Planctomycetota bacterium]|nr:hypothetical protein [Planctomycetota bacterium]